MVSITFALSHDLMQTAATYLKSFSRAIPDQKGSPDRKGNAQSQRVGACRNRKSRATFSEHALGSPGQTTSAFTMSVPMAVTPNFGPPSHLHPPGLLHCRDTLVSGRRRWVLPRTSLVARSWFNGPVIRCQWEYRFPHGQTFTLKCKEVT